MAPSASAVCPSRTPATVPSARSTSVATGSASTGGFASSRALAACPGNVFSMNTLYTYDCPDPGSDHPHQRRGASVGASCSGKAPTASFTFVTPTGQHSGKSIFSERYGVINDENGDLGTERYTSLPCHVKTQSDRSRPRSCALFQRHFPSFAFFIHEYVLCLIY